MKTIADAIVLETGGDNEVRDLTAAIAEKLAGSGLRDGTVTVFVPGSTAGLTTIEYESGAVEDFSRLMEKIVPGNIPYRHDQRWGDGNGYSHVRAALLGPSLVIPFTDGRLALGTWQQAVLVDFDNRPRTRSIVLQFMGE
jgi:secondary thiamine-phosphate synthase enzyme